MTQEEKELLLNDLSARLQHKVRIKCGHCPINPFVTGIFGEYIHHIPYYVGGSIAISATKIEEVKPYLRPMSSMTLEEECEFCRLFECDSVNAMYGYINWVVGGSCDYDEFDIEFSKLAKIIDWLNKHHFDYRGLIEKGLALEAPEDMYKSK